MILKAKIFKGKYEPMLELPVGMGREERLRFKAKSKWMIFSGTAQLHYFILQGIPILVQLKFH